jgi:hypothetical protein
MATVSTTFTVVTSTIAGPGGTYSDATDFCVNNAGPSSFPVDVVVNGPVSVKWNCWNPYGSNYSVLMRFQCSTSTAWMDQSKLQCVANTDSFDPVAAGAFFGLAFTSTMFLWLLSLGAGAIIRMVKSA